MAVERGRGERDQPSAGPVERIDARRAAALAVCLLRGTVDRDLRDDALAALWRRAALQHGGNLAAGGPGYDGAELGQARVAQRDPSRTSSQVIVLLCMVAFGAVLQWRCAPGAGRTRLADGR